MKRQSLKKLQGILWSVDVADLGLEENRSYIVNQILSLGTLEELSWLFKIYTKEMIREIFVNEPAKIYSPSSFNFCENILLGLKDRDLPPERYVKTLPLLLTFFFPNLSLRDFLEKSLKFLGITLKPG